MIIKVDVRETELIEKIQHNLESVVSFKDIKLVKENLPLGDIIINNENQDSIIIERKTLRDLAASIKDGRYEEQSFRLNGIEHHNHNIYYLIEGDIQRFNTFKERLDKQTIYSAIFSISYYKGFSVIRSNTLEESAFIICNMAYKIGKDVNRQSFYKILTETNMTSSIETNMTSSIETNMTSSIETNMTSSTEGQNSKDYVTVVKKVKKENITIDNIGEIMLSQIPNVSSSIALAILSQFKTLPNLIKCIQEDENCLGNICTIDANGKSRKINKNAIASVIKFLKL
jgi:ERCC4-type nuclease